jgi:PAS domain S-box-containing protein
MAADCSESDWRREALHLALLGYLEAEESGTPGDRAKLLRQRPDCAPELREFLETRGQLEAATARLRREMQNLVRACDLEPDLFCVAGLDGFFRLVNINFSRILGYTDAVLLSRPFLEFVHPDDWDSSIAQMGRLWQGLPVFRFVNRYLDTRGRLRWFEWTAKSVPAEGVIFGVASDVTERSSRHGGLRTHCPGGHPGPKTA